MAGRQGLLYEWHISEKCWVYLNTQTMEVTVQQGFEGAQVTLEAAEWFKLMVSMDRELMKQRQKLARMIVAAGGSYVTVKPEGSWWDRVKSGLRRQ